MTAVYFLSFSAARRTVSTLVSPVALRMVSSLVSARVGAKLPNRLGQVPVQCVAALLLDLASLRCGFVALPTVESWFFHSIC